MVVGFFGSVSVTCEQVGRSQVQALRKQSRWAAKGLGQKGGRYRCEDLLPITWLPCRRQGASLRVYIILVTLHLR